MEGPWKDPVGLAQRDIRSPRYEYHFRMPTWCIKPLVAMLHDPRDEPVVHFMCNQLLLVLPAVVLLFTTTHSHVLGALYMAANYALFLQRYMLTLHVVEHRSLFKPEYAALNGIIPHVMGSLYGVPWGMYRLHHVVMHHVEDNGQAYDLSSTEPFQRDNFFQFLRYWLRFAFLTWFELPLYAAKKGRIGYMAGITATESLYWVCVVALYRYNPVATLWSLVIPLAVTTLALMFGNWSQHIFVDPNDPANPYKSTYNCIACPDNSRTYNDGYHIIHHKNSRLHWTQHPVRFIETLQAHDDNDGLVFEGISFFDVGLMVFTRQLDKLAGYVVACGPKQARRTRQEWVELFRERLKPVPNAAAKSRKCRVPSLPNQ